MTQYQQLNFSFIQNSLFFNAMVLLQIASNIHCISSPIRPFATYRNTTELIENVADLWWTVNDVSKEIIFELHAKTTGWIALGIAAGITLN
ncbi:MAG: hypothetical protein IT281_10175 [Ignavibacteria bacterium]|nr:hypothetical protein [Ignavibacteria bacterium]